MLFLCGFTCVTVSSCSFALAKLILVIRGFDGSGYDNPPALGAALVASLSLTRSWVERDLHVGDLRVLSDFAFFRNDRPPSAVVDRLCERGFLAKTARGRWRITLNGWIAVLLRHTLARDRKSVV